MQFLDNKKMPIDDICMDIGWNLPGEFKQLMFARMTIPTGVKNKSEGNSSPNFTVF